MRSLPQNRIESREEQGQTLVLIVLIMIIALSIGLVVSNRLISTLNINTNELKNYRANAVTEAALERILRKTNQELEDYINFGNCGSECSLQIASDDGLVGYASIYLSYLGNSSDDYVISLSEDAFSQVSLNGYPNNTTISICWNVEDTATAPPSLVGTLISGGSTSYSVQSFAYNSVGSIEQNGFSSAAAANGFENCFNLNSQTSAKMIRLKSLYSSIDAHILPAAGHNLPKQGILIEVHGRIEDAVNVAKVSRIYNSMPSEFDYVLFQKSTSSPLSNQ